MVDKKLLGQLDWYKSKKITLVNDLTSVIIEIDTINKKLQESCDHKDENGEYTIAYRHGVAFGQDMHCIQCGKIGSRKELREEI